MPITTPAASATFAEWDAWFRNFSPTHDLTEDQRFLYELGQGERDGSGAGTSFGDRIAAAAQLTPATSADHPATHDPAKLATILNDIATEHASEIASVQQLVQDNQAAAIAAFNEAVARFNAPVASPIETKVIVGTPAGLTVGTSIPVPPPVSLPPLQPVVGQVVAADDKSITINLPTSNPPEHLPSAIPVSATTLSTNGAPAEFVVRSDVPAQASHVAIQTETVSFLHGLLDAVKPEAEAAAKELAMLAFQAAFRKAFPRAAAMV